MVSDWSAFLFLRITLNVAASTAITLQASHVVETSSKFDIPPNRMDGPIFSPHLHVLVCVIPHNSQGNRRIRFLQPDGPVIFSAAKCGAKAV